jgi:murein DD-endopeptidase MepM/ murein hydrolase activator NlpD
MMGENDLKKKLMTWVLIFSVSGLLFIPEITHASATINKIDQELNKLKQIKAETQRKAKDALNQMNKVQSQIKVNKQQMNTLLKQIDDSSQKLSQLNERIDTVSDELVQSAIDLDAATVRVENRNQLLKSRVRLMYMNGVVSYLDVLLGATSFSDFINRLDALKLITEQDKEILDSNIRDQNLIEDKKKQTEEQLAEVKNLYAEANQIREVLIIKEKEKEAKISSLTEQERELEGITEENERKLMEYAAQEAALLKKRSELQKTNVFTYNGGSLGFPLSINARITSLFGTRVDPITKKKGASHNGVDFGASNGTSILAAEDGVVIVASWWGGYGNAVVIDHGKNFWTLYAHIRNEGTIVKKGDVVRRGQKIAEVGSTGRSTGNHLHFEVRINEIPKDPLPYLK